MNNICSVRELNSVIQDLGNLIEEHESLLCDYNHYLNDHKELEELFPFNLRKNLEQEIVVLNKLYDSLYRELDFLNNY